MSKKIPEYVEGMLVSRVGPVQMVRGEAWVTLLPEDDEDSRIWEYSLTTGRILKIQ